MTRETRLARILPVVRTCLERCQRAENPAGELAHFLDGLRCDPYWSEADLDEFERTARRAIAAEPTPVES